MKVDLEDILLDHSSEDDLLEVPLTERVFRIFFGTALVQFPNPQSW